MVRKPWVHFPNALYHVIARGNQRQDIFLDNQDYKTYLNLRLFSPILSSFWKLTSNPTGAIESPDTENC